MNELKNFLDEKKAIYNPAKDDEVFMAENELTIKFSDEYKEYLNKIGCFCYKYIESYGLGISQNSYLNIIEATKEFRREDGFLKSFVPLFDIGDGHYYVYDNDENNIKVLAIPNGGVYKTINIKLEEFLLESLQDL